MRIHEIFIGGSFRAEQARLLEYAKALALRARPAGPTMVANFLLQATKESPPSAADAKDFRAHARPQPSEATPACPTSRAEFTAAALPKFPGGGRTSGAVRTVEVEPEFETPTVWPPKAATRLFFRLQKAFANIVRPASGVRSANAFAYSSKRASDGTNDVTDQNPLFVQNIAQKEMHIDLCDVHTICWVWSVIADRCPGMRHDHAPERK